MPFLQTIPWREPLDIASAIAENLNYADWILLYSGVQAAYSGRFSYLAYDKTNEVTGDDFSHFSKHLNKQPPQNGSRWFGYLGYGLKNSLEQLAPDQPNWLQMPHLCMMQFATILEFDHLKRRIKICSNQETPFIPEPSKLHTKYPVGVYGLTSNMSKKAYYRKVQEIIDRIHAGDLYQANLTRKFQGYFSTIPHAFSLFRQLCNISPAAYSAYIKLNNRYILSSSPELFMKIDGTGAMQARPIKGTSPRFSDPAQDIESLHTLASSAKDRAENLMIVDLMRNDLSRSCIEGSVKASALFEITSHSNVHHMSSTINGQKKASVSTLEAVKNCFPPGSMTGAPKIKAMNLCSHLEEQERGIYSGAIGWIDEEGSCELSVVIRTLIIEGNRFEFQVGGGIVADSKPDTEFMETIDKSRGIMSLLGVSEYQIKQL